MATTREEAAALSLFAKWANAVAEAHAHREMNAYFPDNGYSRLVAVWSVAYQESGGSVIWACQIAIEWARDRGVTLRKRAPLVHA